ncbi:MAG: HIT family protein [Candidatus Yonathbacteria bacterium]|nr:HIT family protein [Candidatus Yonathbacteria bacterium]
MKNVLPIPPSESIVFENDRLYVCSALYPITNGHIIVVWKKDAKDIHDLSDEEYDFLMSVVDITRDAQLKILNVEKVYLLYMDEVKHVHWHLVPRYDEKGFNLFSHNPEKANDFSLAQQLKRAFTERFEERFSA